MSDIILFSTGCSKCKMLKSLLDRNKIPFKESDDVQQLIDRGFTSVPVLLVDDKYMKYNEAVEWVWETGTESATVRGM